MIFLPFLTEFTYLVFFLFRFLPFFQDRRDSQCCDTDKSSILSFRMISFFLHSFGGNLAFRQYFFALTPSLPILVHQTRCVDGCSSGQDSGQQPVALHLLELAFLIGTGGDFRICWEDIGG